MLKICRKLRRVTQRQRAFPEVKDLSLAAVNVVEAANTEKKIGKFGDRR
jgi:hypothetical protein